MRRRPAATIVVLVFGACQPRAQPSVAQDSGLGGPRTLGFIELHSSIPSPSFGGGGGSLSPVEDGADSGAGTGAGTTLGALPADASSGLANTSVEPTRVDDSALAAPSEARAPWVVEPLPPASARAIDARGRRVAIVDGAVVDESASGPRAARVERLEMDAIVCELPRESLSFDEEGNGYLVHAGRVFVRAHNAAQWSRTLACSNIEGEPWVLSSQRGWGVIARRDREAVPALLFTHERDGRQGWFAVSAADREVTAAVLDEDGSRLVLAHGGHPIMIDVTREVAGALLATASVPFEGVSRTSSGVVVWREDGADLDLLVSRLARGPYQRERLLRDTTREGDASREVLNVWAGAGGQRVVVTRSGVELRDAGAAHARTVARWPVALESAQGVSVGRLADGRLAVVTPVAWAREG